MDFVILSFRRDRAQILCCSHDESIQVTVGFTIPQMRSLLEQLPLVIEAAEKMQREQADDDAG